MSEATQAAKQVSRVGIVWGILTLILGMLAIAAPLQSGIAVSTLVGILLIFAGVAQLIWAFGAPSFGRGLLTFLFGGVSILAGALILARPLFALATLTIMLAAYFVVDGICQMFSAFSVRPEQGWGWLLVGGVISLLLGIMIWRQFPLSGAWAVGVLVGIRLIFAGWTMIMLGATGHAAAKAASA